ncbi:MAG: hypothetical protein ABI581_15020 [Sediminibacterium sp.]
MDTNQILKQYEGLFIPAGKLDLPRGWNWLMSGLCYALEEHMKNTEEGKRIYLVGTQPNSGRLVIMFTSGDTILRAMVSATEYASKHVCQICGESNQVGQTGGYPVFTLCRNCWGTESKYKMHPLHPHKFLKQEIQTIELAIRSMRNHWFRNTLKRLLNSP